MAKRSQSSQPPGSADLTPDQMRSALPVVERRLAEVQALDPFSAGSRGHPQFREVEMKIEDTLVSVFGSGTIEYLRFNVGSLDRAPYVMGRPATVTQVQSGYARGKQDAVTKLQTIISLFKEKLGNAGETAAARAIRAIGDLDLHQEIARVATSLFKNGHYANAIEDACKALDGLVRYRSGRFDLGGTDLMNTVFSVKSPLLRFNDLATDSERSEQQGMMQLFAGAMLAFRNPRAHEIMSDDPERALEIISFLSFLAKAVDNAKR